MIRRFFSSRPLESLRNIATIGHIDAGKTTLNESMLFHAGFTSSIGLVDQGTTLMDHMPQERDRGITIQSASVSFPWTPTRTFSPSGHHSNSFDTKPKCDGKKYTINLVDTPGHADFGINVALAAYASIDAAVVLVDAVSGIQPQTKTVLRHVRANKLPKLVLMSRCDRVGALGGVLDRVLDNKSGTCLEMERWGYVKKWVLKTCGSVGEKVGVLQVPLFEKDEFYGILDVVAMNKVTWPDRKKSMGREMKVEALSQPEENVVRDARALLCETLADTDDAFLDLYLASEDPMQLDANVLKKAIRKATMERHMAPVIFAAAFRQVGVQPVLDAVVDYFPHPGQRPRVVANPFPVSAHHLIPARYDKPLTIESSENGQVCAQAFKIVHDQRKGPMTFVRLHSGKLLPNTMLFNTSRNIKERCVKLYQSFGPDMDERNELRAGDIGVIMGLKHTFPGDTLVSDHHQHGDKSIPLHGPHHAFRLPSVPTLPPVFKCAVEPDHLHDEEKLLSALRILTREDPSLSFHQDPETNQLLVQGMGELHLEIALDRLRRDFGVKCQQSRVWVSFREFITRPVPFSYHFSKSTPKGIAECAISGTMTPVPETHSNPPPNSFDIPSSLFSEGSLPVSVQTIRESIQSGFESALSVGPLTFSPTTSSNVTVSSLSLFPTTTPLALQTCAYHAIKESLKKAEKEGTVGLLEPIVRIMVTVPNEYFGPVVSDLSGSRNAKIESFSMVTESDESVTCDDGVDEDKDRVVVARVPVSDMLGYSSILKQITKGYASFSMEMVGYGKVDQARMMKAIKDVRGY